MTAYFYGNANLKGTYMNDILYTNGTIQSTNIDMDMRKITTLATPTQDFDACNKYYVDQRISSAFQEWLITLTGSSTVDIADLHPFSYMFFVGPYENDLLSQGGPTASFVISKANVGISANGNTLSSSPSATNEHLILDWPSNGPLRLRKTGDNYDGIYLVQRK